MAMLWLFSACIAINAGNPAGCSDHDGLPLSTDQRGMTRTSGGICDLGAYEHIP